MPFVGQDFLLAAHVLASHTDDEPCERSAISRSYYAAFHRARDYCDRKGYRESPTGAAHREVRQRFGSSSQISASLSRLHVMRKQADYDVPYPGSNITQQVKTAIAIATQLIQDIDRLP